MSPILGIIASQNYPRITNSYESIATATVNTATASVTFSSIAATYQHLEVRFIARAAGSTRLRMQMNTDTATNYSTHLLIGDGSAAASIGAATQDKIAISAAVSGTASVFAGGVVSVLDYANTNKYKTVRTLSGIDNNGSGEVALNSGSWRNTAAVTSLTFFFDSGNIEQYSSFALYGIKG